MNNEPLYRASGVGKEFAGPTGGADALVILRGVDLTVNAGDSLAILGASGSGKTTLLHLLGALDAPSWGRVFFQGRDLAELDERERSKLRNRDLGFVFQFHHLLPEFTCLENVAMPGIIAGLGMDASLALAREALARVGLADRLEHRVTTLSGGERQRAAIARAILLGPKALLADEPTGSLDERTGAGVADLLTQLNRELGMTLIVVTHNQALARLMSRRLELRTGELYVQA